MIAISSWRRVHQGPWSLTSSALKVPLRASAVALTPLYVKSVVAVFQAASARAARARWSSMSAL